MDEHRRLKRRHLLYYLRVTDRDSGAPIGNLSSPSFGESLSSGGGFGRGPGGFSAGNRSVEVQVRASF